MVAQPGSASALGAEGRTFKSCISDHQRIDSLNGKKGVPKMKKTTPYPTWVCHECGIRYGRRTPTCATYHDNKCDICGKLGPVTQPRDFGHFATMPKVIA